MYSLNLEKEHLCLLCHCQVAQQLNRLNVTSSRVFSPTNHLDLDRIALYYVFRMSHLLSYSMAVLAVGENVDVNPCLILDFRRMSYPVEGCDIIFC